MSLTLFDKYKRMNVYGQEYWTARDMAKILEYSEYRKFKTVTAKAERACKNAWQPVSDHFAHVGEMVGIGSWAKREIEDIHLSRYACYLIIQNADPSKDIVALGQSYFAIQTRIKEVSDQYKEDQKRIMVREEMTAHNKKLFSTAKKAGVKNYATFYDYGYMGLYGGMRKKDILQKKWLPEKANPLDHMSSEELGANLFRATQTEAKLRRENIVGEMAAGKVHYQVGKKVRQTIEELGGTMPENLPSVEHIKEAKKRLKKLAYVWDIPDFVLKHSPVYKVPDTIDRIEKLSSIIKSNPGNMSVRIGDNMYMINKLWSNLLDQFFNWL